MGSTVMQTEKNKHPCIAALFHKNIGGTLPTMSSPEGDAGFLDRDYQLILQHPSLRSELSHFICKSRLC